MARSLSQSAVVAGGTGLAYIGTTGYFGGAERLSAAGTDETLYAIAAVSFLLSLLVVQEGGLALQGPDGRPESRAERARRRLHPV